MKAEIKAEWIAALRSGNYRQGYGGLRSEEDKFCCLGVLCDLAVKAGVLGEGRLNKFDHEYEYGLEGESVSLPLEVMEWSGINNMVGRIAPIGSLIALNDGHKLSFEHIAIVIEEEL